uniref:Uncharacterized protein n=1 Tax=Rhizophora mucronata TaxID=61149 RepID=A0A2P2QZG8_RHIMU
MNYPIWYVVRQSEPVAVTHMSPQKKLQPPITIATYSQKRLHSFVSKIQQDKFPNVIGISN